ncbi:MAG: GNAT family N-acetyltransferase [Acidobacteria bacterium]|nr:GNAT family N-acetyltransferase [Acidobacteriota bacterium]
MHRAPDVIETPRLRLRRPVAADAEAIFARYASDQEVTRYMSWPRHRTVEDTRAFLAFSEEEWGHWPAGPYLIESRETGELLGSTGLGFKTNQRAETGYVLARDAWGRGFATEALRAMIVLAPLVGVTRLVAFCHPAHDASRRVLDKGGFDHLGLLRDHLVFPNLPADAACDVLSFELRFPAS